jgi:uncharacterized protein YdgA (DUF945 family)
MKKISIALLILAVLIAAWLGAAWYTGTRIETQASDALARINAYIASNSQAASGAQIKQVSYQRGLLSSHARYTISSSQLGDAPLSEIDVTLWHGPFPLTSLQGGNLMPRQYQAHIELLASTGPLKTAVDAVTGGKPPLAGDISCSYGRHCVITGSVPAIGTDLGTKGKLSFGGVQMRADLDYQSDTDYKMNSDVRFLPLSISGQNLGSGQITLTGDARSAAYGVSWKTDQGASKLNLTLTTFRPMPFWGDPTLTPEALAEWLKTGSIKVELSKPMAVDLAARALNLTKGVDLAAAQQQIGAQIDTMLTAIPAEMGKIIQTQGDLLVTDWQYADGKLLINGQDNPQILGYIKQGYLEALHAQEQAGANAAADPGPAAQATPGDSDAAAAPAPEPDASAPSE